MRTNLNLWYFVTKIFSWQLRLKKPSGGVAWDILFNNTTNNITEIGPGRLHNQNVKNTIIVNCLNLTRRWWPRSSWWRGSRRPRYGVGWHDRAASDSVRNVIKSNITSVSISSYSLKYHLEKSKIAISTCEPQMTGPYLGLIHHIHIKHKHLCNQVTRRLFRVSIQIIYSELFRVLIRTCS